MRVFSIKNPLYLPHKIQPKQNTKRAIIMILSSSHLIPSRTQRRQKTKSSICTSCSHSPRGERTASLSSSERDDIPLVTLGENHSKKRSRRETNGMMFLSSLAMIAMSTTSTALLNAEPSEAYGLNKPPPEGVKIGGKDGDELRSFLGFKNSSKKERFEESERKKREAIKIREEKEKELEDTAPLMTLPSGIQFREYDEGSGSKRCKKGSKVSILFKVFRLSSGAYFKYSSGGTPVLLWARGYGSEGLDDVGVPYSFVLGEENSLPRAVAPVIVGMRQGGVRRVLMPPNLGYVNDFVQPQPDSYGARRRLENYRDGPLLFEVEVVSIKDPAPSSEEEDSLDLKEGENGGFKLPSAPTLLDR
jgi:FKBP-type peptidyl-prolyl cis-trans isomerase